MKEHRYVPMKGEFLCERCRSWQPAQTSQYVAKKGDPLHAERVCGRCVEKAKA